MHRLFSTSELTNTNTPHTHWHTLSVNPERWSKRSSRSAHSPWEGCETVNCLHNLALFFLLLFFFDASLFPICQTLHHKAFTWCMEGRKVFFLFFKTESQENIGTDLFESVCYSSFMTHTIRSVCCYHTHFICTLNTNQSFRVCNIFDIIWYTAVICCTGLMYSGWEGAEMNERLRRYMYFFLWR